MRPATGALVLLALVVGCSSAKGPPSPSGVFDKRNLITFEEIKAAKTPGGNAFELIERLRPAFLRSRGATSIVDLTPVRAKVSLDGVRYGELESLKSVNVEEIREIEFIDVGDATTRYGRGHPGGAILIRTR